MHFCADIEQRDQVSAGMVKSYTGHTNLLNKANFTEFPGLITPIVTNAESGSSMYFHTSAENLITCFSQVSFESHVDWVREVERTTYVEVAITVEVYFRSIARGVEHSRILPDGDPVEAIH